MGILVWLAILIIFFGWGALWPIIISLLASVFVVVWFALRPVSHERNETIAYGLWFFFGFFGAHYFYLKQNSRGRNRLIVALFWLIPVVLWWWVTEARLVGILVREHNLQLASKRRSEQEVS